MRSGILWRGSQLDHTICLREALAWEYGLVLCGVTYKSTKDGWVAIVKAYDQESYKVAFVNTHTYQDAVEVTTEFAVKGLLAFYPDKFPPRFKRR